MSRRGVNKTTVHKTGGGAHLVYMTLEEVLRERECVHDREQGRKGRDRVHDRSGSQTGFLLTFTFWRMTGYRPSPDVQQVSD
jgi:hypothetical protein